MVLVVILVIVNYLFFVRAYNPIGPYFNIKNINYREGEYIITNAECHEKIETRGISMYPTIQLRDFVAFNKCYNVKNLKRGDVIGFEYDDKLVFHRVINIDYENELLKTKGDNNIFPDRKIKFDDYYGRVCWISSNEDFK